MGEAEGTGLRVAFDRRVLTLCMNVVLGQNLGDCHSGFRVYRREVLETIPVDER